MNMKKIFNASGRFLLFAMAAMLFAAEAKAQNEETTMQPIIEKTQYLVNYLENDKNQEIVRMEMDLLSTSKSTTRMLQKGFTYTIVAYGDYRFEDIDVKVYVRNGSNWTLVDKDTDTDSLAAVSVTPSVNAEYKIEISAYKFAKGYSIGHYGLIICHEMP